MVLILKTTDSSGCDKVLEVEVCPVCNLPIKYNSVCVGCSRSKAIKINNKCEEFQKILQENDFDEQKMLITGSNSKYVYILLYPQKEREKKDVMISVYVAESKREDVALAITEMVSDFLYRKECDAIKKKYELMKKNEETKISKKIYSFKVSHEFANVIERIRRKYYYASLSAC